MTLIRILLSMFCFVFPAQAQEPLEPEKAFIFSARAIDAATLEARWKIADGYYMYRDKFRFTLEGASLGTPQLPPGKIRDDENFGTVEIYRKEIKIRLPIENPSGSTVTLTASSQGCWDEGVCYPPIKQSARLSLPVAAAATALPTDTAPEVTKVSPLDTPSASPAPASSAANEEESVAQLLHEGSLWLVLISFFGFGLLLALTPCVFPMIPILSGIIVGHGHAVSRMRAFVLSAAYVLGMALTYAALGVAAGYSGTLLSAALQNVWVLSAFALIFVLLSLSMFGFYELQLPASWQSRLSQNANRQGGSLFGIGLMGALSALIVGPCVAAPLAGALLYIAQTGDATLGGAALFAMALGMGAPLLLVGVFSRSLLPKSGPWMEAVKKFFGVLMLATALWLVSPVLPIWLTMLGWATLLIVPAIFLHALDPLPPQARGWARFWKGIGVLLLIGGVAMLAGVLGGARDPLQPLSFLRSVAAASPSNTPSFVKIDSLAELEAKLATAGRPVMLDFYADWCVSCKEMEKFTFPDPQVAAKMSQFLLLKADVTANRAEHYALLKRFGLFGPPGVIFFNAHGQEIDGLRVVGYQPADKFAAMLDQALQRGTGP